MSAPEAQVASGYRRARDVTRQHAKSFFFASHLFFGQRRRGAFALYAFCRRLDDMVDVADGAKDGAVPEGLPERLEEARRVVAQVYQALPELAVPGWAPVAERARGPGAGPWHPDEFAALVDCIRHYRIPERPFQELLSGMEMDLTKRRYTTWEELDLYCYRVAGVVGLMMAPVLGCSDDKALEQAADLGRAMQLTNILRDVREDLERDRVYLASEELRAFGLSEDDLRRGVVDERWRAFMRHQIERARAYYARAAEGVPYLTGFGCQRVVRLMGAIYGDILRVIEARGYDVFRTRAYVPGTRKVAIAMTALVRPGAVLPVPRTEVPVPLLPTGAGP